MRPPRRGADAVRSPTSAALLAVFAVLGGCVEDLPPVGHVVVYLDTDAPLPSPPGATTVRGAPAPLFDRVRVELFAPGAAAPCGGCVREFDLDEAMVRDGASLTVVAADGAGTAPRARLRLFRGTPLGPDPAPESTVELVIQLPEIGPDGGVAVTAFLPTDAVGVPIGTLDAPAPATRGWSGSGHAGEWKPARRVPCVGEAQPGEVCIPGGAYWMGDRRLVGLPDTWAANVERLVVVSPFWMDAAEITVREFRDAMTTEFEDTGTRGAVPWTGHYGTSNDDEISDFCTYTAAPEEAHDRLPVNCVWPGAAEAYCAKRGARLPTEAEIELVSGDFASRIHPWGADEPSCDDAVWGRSNVLPSSPDSVSPCAAPGEVVLPVALFDAAGMPRPSRDRVELENGTVFDLAGNLSELTSDRFNEPWEACWNRPGSQVLVDPVCTTPGEEGEGARAVRGGFWFGPSYLTRAAVRFAQQEAPGIQTGLRCVRSASSP
jgi:formylglycine-generating enzyme